ncbi:MAG: hypothetical protein OCD00_14695 [Colwellia sp.]
MKDIDLPIINTVNMSIELAQLDEEAGFTVFGTNENSRLVPD